MKTRDWNKIRKSASSPARDKRVQRRVTEALTEMSLTELRKALDLTQTEVAAAAKMTQSDLSKAERRRDHLLSTLRRIVEALGGKLEVTAVFPGKRVRLRY